MNFIHVHDLVACAAFGSVVVSLSTISMGGEVFREIDAVEKEAFCLRFCELDDDLSEGQTETLLLISYLQSLNCLR